MASICICPIAGVTIVGSVSGSVVVFLLVLFIIGALVKVAVILGMKFSAHTPASDGADGD